LVKSIICNAVPKIAQISDKDGRMVWGEAVGLFGLACFWALTLFMVFREPAAETAMLSAEEGEP
jgi:hypothetical protein